MDNHPQIDILSAPDPDCLNPVYNCIVYCFEATDFVLTVGSEALFSVSWSDPSNYPDGIPIDIAGQAFATGPNDQDSFRWTGGPPLTQAQIRDNCFNMLQANFAFFEGWNVVTSDSPGIWAIIGQARTKGVVAPFTFSFPVAIPPVVFSANGTERTYRENYKVIIEIWSCDSSGTLIDKLSRNAYEPDAETREFCIDISRNMSSFVSTVWPGLLPDSDVPILDAEVCKTICLRYGQIYDEGVTNCDATPQFFEMTSPIKISNSAFQKPEEVDSIDTGIPLMEPFCYTGTPTRFLTDYPAGLPVCPDSCFWLWYNFDADLSGLSNPVVTPYYKFYYTDGTNTGDVLGTTAFASEGCWSVPAGECQVGFLADPLKTIEAIETRIRVDSDFIFLDLSEIFRLEIDVSKCCCTEFYFLNEKGGFDTIFFNCENEVDLSMTSSDVCGFENCEGEMLKGGKAEADRRAFETYKVFSWFNTDYFDLNWFRQFLKSPIRYIKQDDKVYKIKFLTDEIPIYTFEEKIYIELEYILSFELNQQNA